MIRTFALTAFLSACTAAAPIAAIANAPVQSCGVGMTWKQVLKLADDNDWSVKPLDETQLAKAIVHYNEVASENQKPTIAREDVEGAVVAEHDGFPGARFMFFKSGCPVGLMLTIGIAPAQAIMGHDA